MPTYRIRPGAIPKHLKIPSHPAPAPAASGPSRAKPPIRKVYSPISSGASGLTPSPAADSLGTTSGSTNVSSGTIFQLPRFRATRESWIGGSGDRRDAARLHPYAKLKDPMSVRAYDWIVRLSVPTLFLYFLFWSEAGEKSDVAIVRRWSEGLQQDVKDWWNNVPKEEEVDPQILLRMEQDSQP